MASFAVLGAGGWGIALALRLEQNGHKVVLWEAFPDRAKTIRESRENPDFLPGVIIPPTIDVIDDLKTAIQGRDAVVSALPSHVLRSVFEILSKLSFVQGLIVSGTKGIENETLLRMSEVIASADKRISADRIVVLSGPSHAEEVGRGIPTTVVAASSNSDAARRVQSWFMGPAFRVYTSGDVAGVEWGGALKNVIAIAAGISDGVGFGDNTKAALIIRGIVEITRLGTALGAKADTFSGLSGMGDLIVTCASRHSRNRFVGEEIGKGRTLEDVLGSMAMVAEGVRATQAAMALSEKHDIDMPITREVHEILFNRKNPKQAMVDLMTRNPKAEG
jgi:glycerol-3-phosphate dehydrogenase (NAD(P)+)